MSESCASRIRTMKNSLSDPAMVRDRLQIELRLVAVERVGSILIGLSAGEEERKINVGAQGNHDSVLW